MHRYALDSPNMACIALIVRSTNRNGSNVTALHKSLHKCADNNTVVWEIFNKNGSMFT